MPTMFRPRAMTLKDSMKKSSEVTSLRDVQAILQLHIPLRCVYRGYNDKNGWDEYAVTFYGGEYIGFTNSFLEPVD